MSEFQPANDNRFIPTGTNMQKITFGPELTKAINRTAQALVTQAFAAVRADLQKQAREMLTAGKSRAEVETFMVREGLPRVFRPPEEPCDLA
ncbi:cytochrome c-type biogenesis protein CcmH [Variovorax terrae]|uniref:Cytochrome c-type biogenesis protein CcmH n=1 Tax=Variovorax terrae TaxID=2923278 RepID=A0A9X2AQ47_9BURK|nr:cytochrome c-type biogenesis protein CcmH [Variovorax terrae]MCJ0764167.1 cytochrome c-type biogenesis protein CcmH [Variovorax terrae]